MKYLYLPDSYNYNLINNNFKDIEEFTKLQILYREALEKIIISYINFKELDNYILNQNIKVPIVEDKNYNFYHKYSSLGSNYIFLRNNFHIENLSSEELAMLKLNSNINSEFIFKTMSKVIFEEGDKTFFGTSINENLVKSKSIVFEFSYNQALCTEINQFIKINNIIKNIFEFIRKKITEFIKIDASFIVYKALPDLYNNDK